MLLRVIFLLCVTIEGYSAPTTSSVRCTPATARSATGGSDRQSLLEPLEQLADLYIEALELPNEERADEDEYSRMESLSRLMVATIPVLAGAGVPDDAIDIGRLNLGLVTWNNALETTRNAQEACR